jgi:hypothetical protein
MTGRVKAAVEQAIEEGRPMTNRVEEAVVVE